MTAAPTDISISCIDLGWRDYASTLAFQRTLLERVQTDPRQGYLLLVEHDPPVITLGRRGRAEDIVDPAAVAAAGIEVHRVTRGGQATWHGPGQLAAYPIVALRPLGLTLRQYVCGLEEAVLRTLADAGIEGFRREGQTGVWTAQGKIAAIGVAVERWVCWHGLALNVCPDLGHFGLIVPCGQRGSAVTSMERIMGKRRLSAFRRCCEKLKVPFSAQHGGESRDGPRFQTAKAGSVPAFIQSPFPVPVFVKNLLAERLCEVLHLRTLALTLKEDIS